MFTLMLPPHAHMHLQLSRSAGKLATISLPPGTHGATITGTQGIGVSVPIAAAVADATVGLDMDWHIPKGIMLTMGFMSEMLAIGLFCTKGRVGSGTMKVDGAIPKLHWSTAPAQTNFPISLFL